MRGGDAGMVAEISNSAFLATQELARNARLSRASADERASGAQEALRRRAQQQQQSSQTFDAVTFRVDGQATSTNNPQNGIDQNTRLPRGSLVNIVI